ncbi:hypothetical protein N7539_005465 [Penicillium diatomitis]|uniref:Uncharacterized protein n=1 Tax=Penicillium diatomitis TaxID=2819901 RepID=A0A9X0BV03_9EURO|nr:uncharacterized protein N7539_005465 [Penicillium diatomitis]KAJ5485477.1 hypothetical protein N7539_005465 [Penicillium diatomitis]
MLNCFKLHRAGQRPRFWWQHRLALNDYTETLRALDDDNLLKVRLRSLLFLSNYPNTKYALRYLLYKDSRGDFTITEIRDRKQIYSKQELNTLFKYRLVRFPGIIIEV